MKKVLAICLVAIMALSFSLTAFATNGFVSSPSGNAAPTVNTFTPDDANCTESLVVTAYVNKSTLEQAAADKLTDAYNDIANAADITALNADLATLAANKNIAAKNLAVSDLFDASCANSDNYTGYTIALDCDTLQSFVALLHKTADGSWELVSNATVSGNTLQFHVDTLSPFAIVVNTSSNPTATGDSNVYMWAGILAASIAVEAVIFVIAKKKKNA